ncbi:Alpha/beta hydrolase fold [Acidisarcina polymorpha]|uniref:Alpha/beta hydrolase fold n=1 Tax=Acidisarcina polymorpha TaxID=2211140 RepID=A0A2Z5FUZ9_9BACT|nr:alpha/beta hydrolase [Acidisarcina polymorpha]AXC10236.1 Alpha/beta hydrolase fold [Acidisarcina polymorpha]
MRVRGAVPRHKTVFRLLLLIAACCSGSSSQSSSLRWNTLPPTPAPVSGLKRTSVHIRGISLFYSDTLGSFPGRPPVILLHGGLANSDYWGNQIRALMPGHRVLAIDSRGHGRSTRDSRPYGYDLMADDVIALMDKLHIAQADFVGWSDGAILSLDLAIRYPARVRRVFCFAANTRTAGLIPDGDKSANFSRFTTRAGEEYRRLSSTPGEYSAFVEQISHMWDTQPDWRDAQLTSIAARVLVADGDHDEVIRRDHTEYIARTIPGAGLLILPNTSHFAFLQDPVLFNAAMLDFLDRP